MDDKTVQELIQRRIQQIENPPPKVHLNKFLQDLKITQKLFNCKKCKSHTFVKNSWIYDERVMDLVDFKKD